MSQRPDEKPTPPTPPAPPRPNPQTRRKRRMEFRSALPEQARALGRRMMEQGISYDIVPVPGSETVVRGIADPTRHGKKGLPTDLAKGLSVRLVSDQTDA